MGGRETTIRQSASHGTVAPKRGPEVTAPPKCKLILARRREPPPLESAAKDERSTLRTSQVVVVTVGDFMCSVRPLPPAFLPLLLPVPAPGASQRPLPSRPRKSSSAPRPSRGRRLAAAFASASASASTRAGQPRRAESSGAGGGGGDRPVDDDDLYGALGLAHDVGASLSVRELRAHYLRAARGAHPDARGTVNPEGEDEDKDEEDSDREFVVAARAWDVLGDARRRALYHAAGMPGVRALDSVEARAATAAEALPTGVDGETLDFLSETGQLTAGLLAPMDEPLEQYPDDGEARPGALGRDNDNTEDEDACPRSVAQAIWNLSSHPDTSFRYYALWWVYKFKVVAATDALIEVLVHSHQQTSLGGYGLRRRAALALGAVAPLQKDVLHPLADALRSSDYYLRYRAAEAIATIAMREQRRRDSERVAAAPAGRNASNAPSATPTRELFPPSVLDEIKRILREGAARLRNEQASKSRYSTQEGMFDLDGLDPEVAGKLRQVFADRRANEERSRRTTMTPQLGVDAIDPEKDEPYEWLLKALAASLTLDAGSPALQQSGLCDSETTEAVRAFLHHPFPLVRYAAGKTLFTLTGDPTFVEALIFALDYGAEHHYSQRVLIRDLGDLGYAPAADAIAECGMVENSFKILALRCMLAKLNHDPKDPRVRLILSRIDSLL